MEERSMPIWAWVLIILLIVFLLGGFGYRRRR
jgi:purine-cytosine permease-like protein